MQRPSKSHNGSAKSKNNPMIKKQASEKTKIAEQSGVQSGERQTKSASGNPPFNEVTIDERQHLIAEAAYYRAMRRSFIPGGELEDWLDAEAEIEKMLSEMDTDSTPRNA